MPTITSNSFTIPASGGGGGNPLLQVGDISYLGAFRTPEETVSDSPNSYSYQYAQCNGIAYNPGNDSIFMTGRSTGGTNNDAQMPVSEFSIPTLVQSSSYSSLNTATTIQPFVQGTNGQQSTVLHGPQGGGIRTGGLLVSGSDLILSVWSYYVGAESPQFESHFVRDVNLSLGTVSGPSIVGSFPPRSSGGGMASVPAAYQSQFGGFDSICGLGGQAVVGNDGSAGTAMNFFNSGDVGSLNISGQSAIHHTDTDMGPYQGSHPFWTGCSEHKGLAFPSTYSTILCGGRYSPSSAYESPGIRETGGWFYRLWAYDVNDVVDAFNGTADPADADPYATFDLNPEPHTTDPWQGYKGGMCWDDAGKRLFIAFKTPSGSNSFPVIHVYGIA